jgi:hypothetical protein
MPPWNPILGHIPFAWHQKLRYPFDIATFIMPRDIYKENFLDEEMFYLDIWPFMDTPLLIICNPSAAAEVSKKLTTKPHFYEAEFEAESGGPQLLSSNGNLYKSWKRFLNPGFAIKYTNDRVAAYVDSVERFIGKLKEKAEAEAVVQLEDLVSPLVIDALLKIGL